MYRRQLPAIAHNTWQALQADSIDIVIITSGETLTQWLNIAAQQAQKIPILVISSRLADLATQKGIQTVLISASIKPTDIILTLSLWQNRQEHVID